MKQCNKCGVVKPYEQFYKQTKSKDGYQGKCIDCNRILCRQSTAKYRVKEGIGVYALYNKIEQCWDYVGEGNLLDRQQHHQTANGTSTPWQVKLNIWFDDFDNVYEFRVLCECKNKQQCEDMETKYINELNPRYNKNKRQHKTKA